MVTDIEVAGQSVNGGSANWIRHDGTPGLVTVLSAPLKGGTDRD